MPESQCYITVSAFDDASGLHLNTARITIEGPSIHVTGYRAVSTTCDTEVEVTIRVECPGYTTKVCRVGSGFKFNKTYKLRLVREEDDD